MHNYLLVVSVHSEQGLQNRGDGKEVSVILEMLKFLTERRVLGVGLYKNHHSENFKTTTVRTISHHMYVYVEEQ